MSQQKTILAVVADERGEVFEHPDLLMAGMNGMTRARAPRADELIPLPGGKPPLHHPRHAPRRLRPQSAPAADRGPSAPQLGGGRGPGGFGFSHPGLHPHPAAGRRLRPQEGRPAAVVLHRRRLVRRGGALLRRGGARRPQHPVAARPFRRPQARSPGAPYSAGDTRTTASSSSSPAAPSTTTASPPRTSSSVAGRRRCRPRRPAIRAAWGASPCRSRTAVPPARSG